jgi:hypothetical protein
MTIPEIASQLRIVLGVCVGADKDVSSAERSYFAAVQNDASDEQVISFWLSISHLEDHRVPMFVVKQWGLKASSNLEIRRKDTVYGYLLPRSARPFLLPRSRLESRQVAPAVDDHMT